MTDLRDPNTTNNYRQKQRSIWIDGSPLRGHRSCIVRSVRTIDLIHTVGHDNTVDSAFLRVAVAIQIESRFRVYTYVGFVCHSIPRNLSNRPDGNRS